MPYVVSRGGTFGTIGRRYHGINDIPMILIEWGPLRWLTPVNADECKVLVSSYESEAKVEADTWLREQGITPKSDE